MHRCAHRGISFLLKKKIVLATATTAKTVVRHASTSIPTSTTTPVTSVPLMERLARGDIIIGDGGMTYTLEARGFVTATNWTPEAVVEHPEAGTFIVIFTFVNATFDKTLLVSF